MKKILIIEDHAEIRENIAELLDLSGYDTIEASNGREGLALAEKEMPDLIICDIMMPVMDGYAVVAKLNAIPATSAIPFIFLTAKAEKEDFRKGMSLGADDYITKPFKEEELLTAVKARLDRTEKLKNAAEISLEKLAASGNETNSFDKFLHPEERESKTYKKKELIYQEGKRTDYLYFIRKGNVKVFLLHEEGKELITSLYKAGEYFGVAALLEDTPHKDNAEALEASEIVLIPKSDFEQLIFSNMQIAKHFIKMLSNNVSEKEQHLLYMAYDTLRQRVARALVEMYHKYKKQDQKTVKITLNREEVSRYIGTARESFIRMMSDLREEGALDIIDGDIVINDLRKLESFL